MDSATISRIKLVGWQKLDTKSLSCITINCKNHVHIISWISWLPTPPPAVVPSESCPAIRRSVLLGRRIIFSACGAYDREDVDCEWLRVNTRSKEKITKTRPLYICMSTYSNCIISVWSCPILNPRQNGIQVRFNQCEGWFWVLCWGDLSSTATAASSRFTSCRANNAPATCWMRLCPATESWASQLGNSPISPPSWNLILILTGKFNIILQVFSPEVW